MNTFTTNPAMQSVARRTIDDRVQDAERRRVAHQARTERRAARRAAQAAYDESVQHLPWGAFRFVHPVH